MRDPEEQSAIDSGAVSHHDGFHRIENPSQVVHFGRGNRVHAPHPRSPAGSPAVHMPSQSILTDAWPRGRSACDSFSRRGSESGGRYRAMITSFFTQEHGKTTIAVRVILRYDRCAFMVRYTDVAGDLKTSIENHDPSPVSVRTTGKPPSWLRYP
ncbi:hypothetical protein NITHO_3050011 [Nitrolancea hollandica Lb]|uniref:Uncharacterized protein n=1 Tax=Nitrolancea hollandica Lb TaxID=1129897 RepID=I4EHA4_9BACT|nr:hypothetical protein NITHO_3050011 [Nitrolancea hollandica Lb]